MPEEEYVVVTPDHGFDDFYTKIVGVTAVNPDGVSRQSVVKSLRIGQKLHLQREPRNPHDAEAIKVITSERVVVGYIHGRMANNLAPVIDAGYRFSVVVSSLTGGDEQSAGVNIRVKCVGRRMGTATEVVSEESGCATAAFILTITLGGLILIAAIAAYVRY